MSTVNSSNETKERAHRLAEQIGSNHLSINIDEAFSANVAIFAQVHVQLVEPLCSGHLWGMKIIEGWP